MKKVESLYTEKFAQLEKFKITETSKIFGGRLRATTIATSYGDCWDTVNGSNTNFYGDGGHIYPLHATPGQPVPVTIQHMVNVQ